MGNKSREASHIKYMVLLNMNLKKRIITLFALSTCPMCKKVKKRLNEMDIEYEVINVDKFEGGEQWAIMKEVKKFNEDATFPTLVCQDVCTDFGNDNLKSILRVD
jgi:glutaredoxin-like protein NrdH